jgi:hypothetical protein
MSSGDLTNRSKPGLVRNTWYATKVLIVATVFQHKLNLRGPPPVTSQHPCVRPTLCQVRAMHHIPTSQIPQPSYCGAEEQSAASSSDTVFTHKGFRVAARMTHSHLLWKPAGKSRLVQATASFSEKRKSSSSSFHPGHQLTSGMAQLPTTTSSLLGL